LRNPSEPGDKMTMRKIAMIVILGLAFEASRVLAQAPDATDSKLRECILAEAQSGKYSSSETTQSAATILTDKCRDQWIAWMEACQARGDGKVSCAAKSGTIAENALKTLGK
jgi:predicted lipoprotein with Yx(FWY)xxD motif